MSWIGSATAAATTYLREKCAGLDSNSKYHQRYPEYHSCCLLPVWLNHRANVISTTFNSSSGERSRFEDVLVYRQPEVTLHSTTSDTVTINFITRATSTAGLFFEATVLMQGTDKAYTTRVPNAEKELYSLTANNRVTITGLDPGRRFLIRLKPVDSVGADYTNPTLKVNDICHAV